jgi:hypothetical protein
MAAYSHVLLTFALAAASVSVRLVGAELPKDSPFNQAGGGKVATKDESLEFAGVSTVGKKTMINLYDREAKRGFWVQEGTTSDGVTVVKYDSSHDQVTIRRNGAEKLLPLRAASAVVSGPVVAPTIPAMQPISPPPPIAGSTPAAPPITPATDPAAPTPTTPAAQTRARQEEEARMLVSDLLEIGIAQRKAYEEAQRKASGQPQSQPGTAGAQPAQSTSTPTSTTTDQPNQPAAPATPTGG